MAATTTMEAWVCAVPDHGVRADVRDMLDRTMPTSWGTETVASFLDLVRLEFDVWALNRPSHMSFQQCCEALLQAVGDADPRVTAVLQEQLAKHVQAPYTVEDLCDAMDRVPGNHKLARSTFRVMAGQHEAMEMDAAEYLRGIGGDADAWWAGRPASKRAESTLRWVGCGLKIALQVPDVRLRLTADEIKDVHAANDSAWTRVRLSLAPPVAEQQEDGQQPAVEQRPAVEQQRGGAAEPQPLSHETDRMYSWLLFTAEQLKVAGHQGSILNLTHIQSQLAHMSEMLRTLINQGTRARTAPPAR